MFDVGFWELLVVGVIGLIVLGPERLPKVARTLGHWAGRARMYARTLTSELEREVNTTELRKTLESTRDEFEEGHRRLQAEVREGTVELDKPRAGTSSGTAGGNGAAGASAQAGTETDSEGEDPDGTGDQKGRRTQVETGAGKAATGTGASKSEPKSTG